MKTISKLTLTMLAMVALLLPPARAQQQTVQCDDGRVVLLTPFNQSNPCGNPVTIDPAKDVPDEFLLVFGPPPRPTGRSLQDRIARIEYEQSLKVFRGLIEAPAAYFQKPALQPTAAKTIAEYYASWGLGEPVFYRDIYGEYVRWPHAIYGPHRAPLSMVGIAPGVIVAQWHVGAIQDGVCVHDAMPFVPLWLTTQNARNCAQ